METFDEEALPVDNNSREPPVYTSDHAMIDGIDRFQSHEHI